MANPVILGVDGDSLVYNELDGNVLISPDASVTDADLTDFENGVLTVAISGVTDDVDDRLTVSSSAAILVDEGTIFDGGGIVIGYISGGIDPSVPLMVTFTVDADASDVGEVIKAVGFANGSGDPEPGVRNLDFVLTDGDGGISDTVTASVEVIPFEDAPVALPDQINVVDNQIRLGDLFADNGFGNDSDPDGPPLTVTAVNGDTALVGVEFTLASGARLRVNADGTFRYDTNGQFAYRVTEEKATLTNTVFFGDFVDGFTYTLSAVSSAAVSVTVRPVDGPEDELHGDSGDGLHSGTAESDLFILDQGGNDEVSGGDGDDQFYFGATFTNADRVVGEAGDDSLVLRGSYTLALEADDLSGIEAIVFRSEAGDLWNATLTMADANVLAGGRLRIDASEFKSAEVLDFDGRAETDGSFEVLAGSGRDLVLGGDRGDLLSGNGGGDWISGGRGNDKIEGGSGRDELSGDGGDDELVGGTGRDHLEGGMGDDMLFGGGDMDTLDGGKGADQMAGGDGNDSYRVDHVGDVVIEPSGGGKDMVLSSISYRLPDHVEQLRLLGGGDLSGRGNDLDNLIIGNSGDNYLSGYGGDDRIEGGDGDDILIGGRGLDTLIGGSGQDMFLFNTSPAKSNTDRIYDFESGEDRMVLDEDLFAAAGRGTLSADAFHLGATAQDAEDRILYDASTGRIYFDPDGTGSVAAVMFAAVSAGTPVVHSDFLIG